MWMKLRPPDCHNSNRNRIVLALAAGIAASQALTGLLVGVTASDLLAWVGPPFILVTMTLVASWIPARRASRVDPMRALRTE